MCIIRSALYGYCMGVKEALDKVNKYASQTGAVFTMGPIIHNPKVLSDLAALGVGILSEQDLPQDLSGAVVIIRAHGISPHLEQKLYARHAKVVDATCPKVKANQNKARQLMQEGYRVFLAGRHDHGEIIAIKGYAPTCIVVEGPLNASCAAARLYEDVPFALTALIGQSTISPAEYKSIACAIKAYFSGLLVVDTICSVTQKRQEALRELCNIVEAVIVVGGRESENTRALADIAQESGKPTWLVECAEDIPKGLGCYARIGICSGTSTPNELIDEIAGAGLALPHQCV